MESSVTQLAAAVTASAAHASGSSAVGSNIGPGLPLLVGLAVIGLVIYLIRRRKRASSSGRDNDHDSR
jgi:LPXTG-motif cell wall-anchored protein